jgi:hypothetical protein
VKRKLIEQTPLINKTQVTERGREEKPREDFNVDCLEMLLSWIAIIERPILFLDHQFTVYNRTH